MSKPDVAPDRLAREAPSAAFVDIMAPLWRERAAHGGRRAAARAFLDYPAPRPAELPGETEQQILAALSSKMFLDDAIDAFGPEARAAAATFAAEVLPVLRDAALEAARGAWRAQHALLAHPDTADLMRAVLGACGPEGPLGRGADGNP